MGHLWSQNENWYFQKLLQYLQYHLFFTTESDLNTLITLFYEATCMFFTVYTKWIVLVMVLINMIVSMFTIGPQFINTYKNWIYWFWKQLLVFCWHYCSCRICYFLVELNMVTSTIKSFLLTHESPSLAT